MQVPVAFAAGILCGVGGLLAVAVYQANQILDDVDLRRRPWL